MFVQLRRHRMLEYLGPDVQVESMLISHYQSEDGLQD